MKKIGAVTAICVISLLLLFSGEKKMGDTKKNFHKNLPDRIGKWKKKPGLIYTRENLFEYINGGAELYISYHFSRLDSMKYSLEDQGEIRVDIFDMGNSHHAYGIFSHGRETEDNLVGQGSEYASGLLTFWQDRYYVSILAYPETPRKKEIVMELGELISGLIHSQGPLPPILSLLPRENLIPHSIHYFFHHIWLNSFHFISNENILNISPDTPAVLAKYRHKETSYLLLLVHYPGRNLADSALKNFKENLFSHPRRDSHQQKNGKWTAAGLTGNHLLILLNIPDENMCHQLMINYKNHIK
jgi:hypothetical protein